MTTISVLVVEDELLAAEVHADYAGRVEGFSVAGVVRSAGEAHRFLARDPGVDLVLLDLNLPDGHGLGLVTRLHAERSRVDVIAVTSAREADTVRRAVDLGVKLYLLKPFSYAMFREKLLAYADYRARLDAAPREIAQEEVDRMLGSLHPPQTREHQPKGISEETLRVVVRVMEERETGASASEIAEESGVSRVTARRYLEHLCDRGKAERTVRHVLSGRPEVEYHWRRDRDRA